MPRIKKIINFRLPFAAAIAMVSGVALSYAFMRTGTDYFWLLAFVPLAAAAFILSAIFSRKARGIIFCAVVIAFFALGAVYGAVILTAYSASPVISGTFCTVEGVVEEVGYSSSGSPYLVLSSASADGVTLTGKVIVYLGEEAGGYVYPGYTVSTLGYLSHYDLISYGELNYRVIGGTAYYLEGCSQIEYTYGFSLFSSLRSGIYAVLFDNLDYETAAVAYAMITGDTNAISSETLDSFRYGGVSHIFAVSGLNITILYVAVTAIFKRLHANRWISFSVSLAVIFVYTGMCGFTLSAVRAAIMCAVAAVTSLAYKKYDGLNSLSLSVIIITLLNPLNIFDVGFILSVSAMLGIIFLSPGVARGLKRLPSGIKNSIAMSLGSQATTFPALLLTFGYISGAGLILNIVVLPLLSFLYVLMFACVVVCAVIPAACVILPYAALPLQAVINFFVGFGFENSLLSVYGGWWTAVIVFIGVAALSDKFNFSVSFRAAVGGICALSFALGCVLGGAVFGDETRIVAEGYYGGTMILVRDNGNTTLILTSGTYSGGVYTFVNAYAPGGVDDIVIIGGDESAAYYYQCGVTAEEIWLSPSSLNLGGLDGTTVRYERNFTLGGTYYEFIDGYTLSARAGGVSFCVAAGQNIDLSYCDLLFSLYENKTCEAATTVYCDLEGGDFDLYTQGCLQFIANGGTLVLTGYVPAN